MVFHSLVEKYLYINHKGNKLVFVTSLQGEKDRERDTFETKRLKRNHLFHSRVMFTTKIIKWVMSPYISSE